MTKNVSASLLLSLTACILSASVNAQHGVLKESRNPFHKAYHDSLKAMNYTSPFPLLGKKAYKRYSVSRKYTWSGTRQPHLAHYTYG